MIGEIRHVDHHMPVEQSHAHQAADARVPVSESPQGPDTLNPATPLPEEMVHVIARLLDLLRHRQA
jgi:hypothetical protein